ncbi:MAG: metal-sulfur cluster assembly factor [Chlorobi bacterium]|nr:metal-sulfur cluster assembly factor [Chlorobiota bacterium]
MISEEKILELLKGVIDPEIGLDIVSLGLVYKVEVNEDSINVTMTLTTPGCPMHGSITEWVNNILLKAEPDKNINVNLVWEPQWTPELMTDEAKEKLGM